MGANTIGKNYCLTTFGESHGVCIGGVIDGCPPNIEIDMQSLNNDLMRRKSSRDTVSSQRCESDSVEFLSGLFEGKTTGAPIAFTIKNEDAKSDDYDNLKDVFRPSHADYTYQMKYGIRDHKGGGRASARTLLPCVVAGSIAKQILATEDIYIEVFVKSIGDKDVESENDIAELLSEVRNRKDTVGCIIGGSIKNLPVGLGEPAFRKFHAVLGQAMLSLNGAKGFEIGEGFKAARMFGSECNDCFESRAGMISKTTNHSGGVLGGITDGSNVEFSVAFKPIPSVMFPQHTVNKDGNDIMLTIRGRHDVCVVPRVIPIVEAMAAMVSLDFLLESRIR